MDESRIGLDRWRRITRRLRSPAALLTLLLIGGVVVACDGWEVWDNIFRKRYYGWKVSDGGVLLNLPGNAGVWIFGDTWVHADTDKNTNAEAMIAGNTIATHRFSSPATTPPTTQDDTFNGATGVKFYARATGTGNVRDITWDAAPASSMEFFRPSCSDTSAVGGAPGTDLVWPAQGIYQTFSGFLAVLSTEFAFVQQPGSTTSNWYPMVNHVHKVGGISTTNPTDVSTWTCAGTTTLPVQYNPFPPTPATADCDPQLNWGQALAFDPARNGVTLIWGTRRDPGVPSGDNCTNWDLFPDAKLARVLKDADLYDSTKWEFLYRGGQQGCPVGTPCFKNIYPSDPRKRDALQTVAWDVAPEFSIEQVSHIESGETGTISGSQFVMVHGTLAPLLDPNGNDFTPPPPPGNGSWFGTDAINNFRTVVMRTSSRYDNFPDPVSGAKINDASGHTIGSTGVADLIGHGADGLGAVDARVVSGVNRYRSIHALKGHNTISEDGNVVITYAVWREPAIAKVQSEDLTRNCYTNYGTPSWDSAHCNLELNDLYYTAADQSTGPSKMISAMRFTKVPLKRVWPWCQAHGNDCR